MPQKFVTLLIVAGSLPVLCIAWGVSPRPPATGSRIETSLNLEQQAARLARQLEFQNLTLATAKPFIVVSDLSADSVNEWIQDEVRPALEFWRSWGLTTLPDQPIEVWLLQDRESYERQSRRRFGEPPGTRFGYYLPRQRVIVVNVESGSGTLLHELSHPIVAANFPRCPPWLSEGFASLWEAAEFSGDKLQVRPTRRLEILRTAIRQHTTRPLRQLFQATTDELSADRTGVLYAQAHALCEYFYRRGELLELMGAIERNADIDSSGYASLERLLAHDDMHFWQKSWETSLLSDVRQIETTRMPTRLFRNDR